MTTLDLQALLIEHGHLLKIDHEHPAPAGLRAYSCVHVARGTQRELRCRARAHIDPLTDTVTWSNGIRRSCIVKQPATPEQPEREEIA